MPHRALRLVRFETHALNSPLTTDLHAIIRAGLAAADAGPLVTRALRRSSTHASKVWLVAAGKAAAAMAHAASDALGTALSGGVVISPQPSVVANGLIHIVGEHPQPGHGSVAGGRAALDVSRGAGVDDLLLVLLSGGASSLMAVPAGISLEDKRLTTGVLLKAGADIHGLNTVRKHLSAIKGGQLAAASAARCLTLVISDVVGDDPSVIASGPTVADASTFDDAWRVIEACGGPARFPEPVIDRLQRGRRGELADTPKPGDARLGRSTAEVIGGRFGAIAGAAAEATSRGYQVVTVDAAIVGEARVAALDYFAEVMRHHSVSGPTCVLSGGETTVTVRGAGLGGRNQEFALALVEPIAALSRDAAFASVGTDGIDGPTDAAGAVVDRDTLARGKVIGREPAAALAENDSYHYFAAIGDLINTGPTGTNVGDLQVFLLA